MKNNIVDIVFNLDKAIEHVGTPLGDFHMGVYMGMLDHIDFKDKMLPIPFKKRLAELYPGRIFVDRQDDDEPPMPPLAA